MLYSNFGGAEKEDAINEMKKFENGIGECFKKNIDGYFTFGKLTIRVSELIAFDYEIIEE